MRNALQKALAIMLVFGGLATSSGNPTLKLLYQRHRWFDLRAAIRGNEQNVSDLYLGAVASAFNERERAERYLNRAIQRAPDSGDAIEAHKMLGYLYGRSGRYREATKQFDAILKIKPDRSDVGNVRAMYAAFGQHPDQSVELHPRSTIHTEIGRDGIVLPVSIHGKTVRWALDTDLNISLMSESAAHLLGVAVEGPSVRAADTDANTTSARTAIVDELNIANVKLHSVAFLVVPDAQLPGDQEPAGDRGLLGLPVALALQVIAWKSDGTFEMGSSADEAAGADGNLCFDGFSPVVRVRFEDRDLDFILDTGNQAGTELWTRFAEDFAALIKQRGTAGKQTLTGIAGSNERETSVLPEVRLRVGGLETMLQPAKVFSKPVGDEFHHGLLGLDVLAQAREVRLDFRSMTLKLLP
jgi:aspartyl protease